jgi:hypothetical protein
MDHEEGAKIFSLPLFDIVVFLGGIFKMTKMINVFAFILNKNRFIFYILIRRQHSSYTADMW